MTTAEILAAADSFLAFKARRGLTLEEAWCQWSRFRRLSVEDSARIHQVAHETLFARGDTTEPPPLAA